MKPGDLVKRKFVTHASLRRAKALGMESPSEPGIIIEAAENACKVVFPSLGGNIRTFLKSSLEIIACE